MAENMMFMDILRRFLWNSFLLTFMGLALTIVLMTLERMRNEA